MLMGVNSVGMNFRSKNQIKQAEFLAERAAKIAEEAMTSGNKVATQEFEQSARYVAISFLGLPSIADNLKDINLGTIHAPTSLQNFKIDKDVNDSGNKIVQ